MAQEYKPGEIVPQSGIYTITHDQAHADMPHEVTVIKGRRFPTCRRRGTRGWASPQIPHSKSAAFVPKPDLADGPFFIE